MQCPGRKILAVAQGSVVGHEFDRNTPRHQGARQGLGRKEVPARAARREQDRAVRARTHVSWVPNDNPAGSSSFS